MKKLISFCVWGDDPKYCIGAVKNAILAKQIYPDWICRYHCDQSVPKDVIEKLKSFDNVEIFMFENNNNWKFTVSRLFPLDDPNIEYIIFRDVDSRLSNREKAAVDEWILSGKSAHIMKDHPWHGNFPILAGMFGLKCGIIKNITNKLKDFQVNEQYHYDQIFINENIYPLIKDDCVIHDEIFEKKSFPTKRINHEFVGEVFDENENTVPEHTEVLKKFFMKTVILSTDDNLDYISYLPYIQKAWNNLGWKTLTFYLGSKEIQDSENNKIIKINSIEGVKDTTVVQVSRLFGSKYTDGLIMTSDVDMMPLSNYWHPDENTITCYGSDLTYYKYHPICYIASKKENWDKLIYEKSIEELLAKYPQSKSNNFNEWWFVDQDIITERIEKNQNRIIIPRTFDNNLALGRIDRVDWEFTKNRNTIKIDAHMPRPFNKQVAEEILFKFHKITINE